MAFLKLVWQRWKTIARFIGNFQARLLLSVFYLIIVTPFAIGVKLLADPLGLKRRSGSHWLSRKHEVIDPWDEARRQF